MATKLFKRNTTLNGVVDAAIASIIYDLAPAAGAAVDTVVTNSQAGTGWEAQATKTAGGSTVAWITGRVPAGGFTLTQADISVWQVESNMNANIGGRFRVYKYSGGALTEMGGGPFDDGVEMNTADREDTWIGNMTDTALAENDRIVLKYFITNAGTGASGHTGTMKFNAADAATGDSFFNLAETVTFKAEDQSITGAGAIATAESFGTLATSFTLSGAGNIATAESFGTDQLNLTLPAVGGLASEEAFGTLSANLSVSGAGAIDTAEAFGAAAITGVQSIAAAGDIATGEAFGTLAASFTVSGAGAITTEEVFGAGQLNLEISGLGNIASAEAFGTAAVGGTSAPGSITSIEAARGSVTMLDAGGSIVRTEGGLGAITITE